MQRRRAGRHPKDMILVTGATGYVGGHLLRALLAGGLPVRCLARRPAALAGSGAEIAPGDALDAAAVRRAVEGVATAYYLIHSMAAPGGFEETDRRAAAIFAEAARDAGVRRIVYLGGLGSGDGPLSPHLRSRHEVGGILRGAGVPVVEFRASIVIGAGSLSFEMVRALTERLPVMIAPRWVAVPAQPIAIADLVAYLVAALDLPAGEDRIYEIGGAGRVSYGGLMAEYACQRGLHRLIVPVPVLTPRLSSLWLGLVTPVYVRVGRRLVESIRHPTVVEDPAALARFPVRPCGYREAIARALREEPPALSDVRALQVPVAPAAAFAPIDRIGGNTGWYYGNWLWRLRGVLDRLAGGIGLRRGRPAHLAPGAALDCWRVERYEPGRLLRLAAEMKLPGRAWLEFRVEGDALSSTIRQTAAFDPRGLAGRAYWYAVYPLHQFVFAGMLRGIARAALKCAAET